MEITDNFLVLIYLLHTAQWICHFFDNNYYFFFAQENWLLFKWLKLMYCELNSKFRHSRWTFLHVFKYLFCIKILLSLQSLYDFQFPLQSFWTLGNRTCFCTSRFCFSARRCLSCFFFLLTSFRFATSLLWVRPWRTSTVTAVLFDSS